MSAVWLRQRRRPVQRRRRLASERASATDGAVGGVHTHNIIGGGRRVSRVPPSSRARAHAALTVPPPSPQEAIPPSRAHHDSWRPPTHPSRPPTPARCSTSAAPNTIMPPPSHAPRAYTQIETSLTACNWIIRGDVRPIPRASSLSPDAGRATVGGEWRLHTSCAPACPTRAGAPT